MTTNADRYRTLLNVSGAVAGEPSVEAILCSLRPLLANISALHGADLFLLDDGDKTLQLFAFDRAPDAPKIPAGFEPRGSPRAG